jgi:Tol biopolymer transport system component/DNA-binding winged helix-turn-helix (wHTH) protein
MSQPPAHDTDPNRARPGASADVYAFGPCRVDVARHVVTRDGRPLSLAPKTFELLLMLVRSGGRALSRHQLMAALWPDTIVEEANLSFQVSTLRKVLGEGADRWIETVPKYGYRLALDVTDLVGSAMPPVDKPITSDEGGGSPTPRQAAMPGRPRRPHALLVSGGLTITLVVALAIGGLRRDATSAPPAGSVLGSASTPLTAFIGNEGAPSLSPDGTHVAFHWSGPNEDNMDIYVISIGGGEPVRLTSDPWPEGYPAWSPDGRRLAFVRRVPGQATQDLMVVPSLGGTARRVAAVQLFGPTDDQPGATALSWTPDSKWIAMGGVIGDSCGIWLVAADATEKRRITTYVDREWGPVFSSDGRRMAFIRQVEMSQSVVYIQSLGAQMQPSGPPVAIAEPGSRQIVSVQWEPGDRALIYSAGGHMGRSRLWRIALDADGRTAATRPEPLAVGDQATGLDISASGRMVYASKFRDTGFWRLNLAHAEIGLDDSNLPASTFDEHTPDYSPDGTRLAFASTRSGTEEIWIANADGTQPRQMTTMNGPLCANPQWSPDGTRLLFDSIHTGERDLYLLDVATAEVRRITSGPDREQVARWSSDGAWIYFGAAQPGNPLAPAEVRRMPAGGGPAVTLTEGIYGEPSHDGRWLFVTRLQGGRTSLWRMALPDGEPTLLVDGLASGQSVAVGRDAVYFVTIGVHPTSTSIDAIDIASGRRRTLAPFGKRWWWGLALSPDERTLLIPGINSLGTDLMLVEPAR